MIKKKQIKVSNIFSNQIDSLDNHKMCEMDDLKINKKCGDI